MKGEQKTKSRMISFRVSETEFEMVKRMTEVQGTDSVSKFARFAICGAVEEAQQNGGAGVQALSGDIRELREEVRRLTRLFEDARRVADPEQK